MSGAWLEAGREAVEVAALALARPCMSRMKPSRAAGLAAPSSKISTCLGNMLLSGQALPRLCET